MVLQQASGWIAAGLHGQLPPPAKLGTSAASAHAFDGIIAVRALDDGTVSVAVRSGRRTSLHALRASLRGNARAIGRNGTGPREYQAIRALIPVRRNRTLPVDGDEDDRRSALGFGAAVEALRAAPSRCTHGSEGAERRRAKERCRGGGQAHGRDVAALRPVVIVRIPPPCGLYVALLRTAGPHPSRMGTSNLGSRCGPAIPPIPSRENRECACEK